MKKITIFIITSIISMSAIAANATTIPRETAPMSATEEQIQITENLMGDILDEVIGGAGYGITIARANTRIRKAVIAGQTDGYGYGILYAISQNALRTVHDMYLRPDYYNQLNEKLTILLADIILDVQNGKDYYTAYEEAQTLIYKSANPNYDPAVDKVGDFCYWNIPPVDSAEFTVARKLLLNATK